MITVTRRAYSALKSVTAFLFIYFLVAYFILPDFWSHYEHHPKMAHAPKTTENSKGVPGDPLNVGLVGTRQEIIEAMVAAGWYPADPITLKSALQLTTSVLLNKPYPTAPVSRLYLWGRPQDMAFEKPAGFSAKRRDHVRLWETKEFSQERLLWVGAATFDDRVGLDRRTGQITHHIAPDIDFERDQLMSDLQQSGKLEEIYQVSGVAPTLIGRNAGGDWYYTDGELSIGVVAQLPVSKKSPEAVRLPNPQKIEFKKQTASWLRALLRITNN